MKKNTGIGLESPNTGISLNMWKTVSLGCVRVVHKRSLDLCCYLNVLLMHSFVHDYSVKWMKPQSGRVFRVLGWTKHTIKCVGP